MEFEFAPCDVVIQCVGMLNELVSTFCPNDSKRIPGPLNRQRVNPDNYTVSDTMEQYLWIFNEMRKKVS